MTQAKKLLYLQLYQAEILISNSKKYSFSDRKKEQYLQTLCDLFYAIKSSIDNGFDESKVYDKKKHLDFVFKSLEFLKDSTLNTLPFEVVGCLDKAMNDWIDAEDFIIVTSLHNNLYSFSYDIQYANKKDLLYQSLISDYGVTFKRKLVQINLPLVLSKDYLSSVALYHELGHFVDSQHPITTFARYVIVNHLNDAEKNALIPYFPYLANGVIDELLLNYHLGEYFCDLFAAQYIGSTLSTYLEYITSNNSTHSNTHPSTVNRTLVVKDFLAGKTNPLISLFQGVLQHLTGKIFEMRFDTINSDDFYELVPYDIKNDRELHGIIVYGWKIWLSDFKKFNEMMKYEVNLADAVVYKVINSLVEKSIGNYFITNNWVNSKNE